MEQWTPYPDTHGGYGSTLQSAGDPWYHNRIEDRTNCSTTPAKCWQWISGQTETLIRWIMSASGFWRFHHTWCGEIGSNSEVLNYWNHLSRTLRACPTSGALGWCQVAVLPYRVQRCSGDWVWLLSLSFPSPRYIKDKNVEIIVSHIFL